MFSFALGIFVGATLVGSSVSRTIHVSRGNTPRAVFATLCNSAAYFLSTYWVATKALIPFFGTVAGSLIVVVYMSQKEKRDQD